MGTKPKKPLTEEEKYEIALQMEQELGRFRRQCMLMERERSAFTSGTDVHLARHRKVLQILKKEQKNLMIDLNIATSERKVKVDKEIAAELHDLLQENDVFTDEIKTNQQYVKEINDQIYRIGKQVDQNRAKQITDLQLQGRILAGEKAVDNLENKLDVQVKKFCTILTENRHLREDIDHLIIERKHFNKVWEKLLSNLNTGKKFMLDLIEQATIAYDQREEWCQKLAALRVRAHTDLIMQTQEMCELQGRIDDDQKLEEFMNIKGQKRLMLDLEERERKKRQMQRENMEKLIKEYTTLLDNVMEFTGYDNIETVASEFKKQEEENFARFQYISELNREMEDLSDKLGHLHMDIDEQRALNQNREQQQEDTLIELRQKLENETRKANEEEAKLQMTDQKLENLLVAIDGIFKLCKCSNDPLIGLLGENSIITKYNVMLYLELLEETVSQLVLNVYYKEKMTKKKVKSAQVIKDDKVKPRMYGVNQIVRTNPCPLCVQHEQVSDVIDTLQFALNRDEIQVKLNARLTLPDGLERLHNVSACHLPESRQIIQRRYQ